LIWPTSKARWQPERQQFFQRSRRLREGELGLGRGRARRLAGHSGAPDLLDRRLYGRALHRINITNLQSPAADIFFGTPGNTNLITQANTYHGWFLGGGMEAQLTILPRGWFVRSEYRYASYDSATLPIIKHRDRPGERRRRLSDRPDHQAGRADDPQRDRLQVQLERPGGREILIDARLFRSSWPAKAGHPVIADANRSRSWCRSVRAGRQIRSRAYLSFWHERDLPVTTMSAVRGKAVLQCDLRGIIEDAAYDLCRRRNWAGGA